MKYAHTCIRVQNLEASIEFYEKALGYKVTNKKDFPEGEFTLVYMALPGDTPELELTYNYNHGPYELGDGYGHVALYTEDLEGDYKRMKEMGYEVTDLSGLPGEDPHYFFVKDPDGYKTEIIKG
ncbi:VOC family protein [Peptoniphilus sp. KCTC 25270]|uniref:lactoylglutathione lyase n=1 Tax=Peptoniphilus sp. KCTC 25270 TaxID=2897414 RepID=UPI001E2A63E0|nr:VOC family protein [Peptoniphilus sp. KCTC 25270]MCD1147396.1 VOC family protein [Peptoniphilus sp. KCTC 25270]